MPQDRRAALLDVIRRVRNRWRLRLALRGAVIVLAGTVMALLLSARGLEALRFSSYSIIAFRIGAMGVFAALVAYGLVRPLLRRVSESQVALYLEECDPSLEAAILSAVEASSDANPAHSPKLVEQLVEQAIEQCRAIDHGRTIERAGVRRHLVTLASVAAAAVLLVMLGPAYLRHGLSALLVISRSAEASSPYKIDVRPGNANVPRGSDQTVSARLVGFKSKDATLMMRTTPGAAFERVPLVPTTDPIAFEGMLFHLDKATEYYVESNGVRSPTFSMSVLDLPTVKQLELEYHFPAYTALPPRKVETGGDVAALRGTEVVVHVVPTMATPGGSILLNDSASSALTTQPDGSLTGSFKIERQGFYKIELTGPHGEKVDASPQYTIDVLDDQPPSVSFAKPGRDTSASPVEDLFVEARADDDFGVKQLQLLYSVNGGAEKTVSLFGGAKAAHRSDRRPHDLSRGARAQAGRLRVLLRAAPPTTTRVQGAEDDDERHLLRADPAVPQGLQAGAVGRRRWRRRRQRGRRPLAAAARDCRRHVQRRPRQAEDGGRQVPRERRVPHAGAGQAAGAGRRAGRQVELPPSRRGSGVQEDRRGTAQGGDRNEIGRIESEGPAGQGGACRPSSGR